MGMTIREHRSEGIRPPPNLRPLTEAETKALAGVLSVRRCDSLRLLGECRHHHADRRHQAMAASFEFLFVVSLMIGALAGTLWR